MPPRDPRKFSRFQIFFFSDQNNSTKCIIHVAHKASHME